MKKIICLSGLAGSGKSTIGKQLASLLEVPFLSIGNFTREYATSFQLDINQFQKLAASTQGIDEMIDKRFIELVRNQEKCVLDYRLGFHFIPEAFHVLLQVEEFVATNRIIGRNDKTDGQKEGIGLEIQIEQIRERNGDMRDRLFRTYGVDFTDETNYDMIIDTTSISATEAVLDIIANVGGAIYFCGY